MPKPALKQMSPKAARNLVAGVVIALILLLLGAILFATGGRMNQGFGIMFFVGVALITGITFWVLTPSPDAAAHLLFKNSGFRLGGGAAIGLVFAWAAWSFVPADGAYIVVSLPDDVPDAVTVRKGKSLRSVELLSERRVLVEFAAGARAGKLTLTWLSREASPTDEFRVTRVFDIDRFGKFEGVDRE